MSIFILQISSTGITVPGKDATGLLITAVIALSGVIVTLALYIRKLHNKHTDVLLKNTETMTKVIADVQNSLDNNTDSNNSLSETVNDLHLTILKGTK